MSDRRYSEEEVAAIFERAAEAQRAARGQLAAGGGMTLADLEEIGRDVGIPPELIADAARSLDRGERSSSRRMLGLPIGVGHSIDLDRRLSADEWERLVVDLRDTFDARGRVRYDGPFRQWTNGNLQALLEPTATGQRLRLRTLHGNARASMTGGIVLIGLAAAVLMTGAVTGQLADMTSVGALLSTLGLGMFGVGALRLPRWARLRRRQMEAVAERLALATQSRLPDGPPGDEG